MKIFVNLKKYFDFKTYFSYVVFFVLVFGILLYVNSDLTFADPDSFYHAKMALILQQYGAITEFPWLTATDLQYSFIDHHFLYHGLLIPFVNAFEPLVGLKFATVLLATLTIAVFFWLLRQLKIQGAIWYALLLVAAQPFIFRLNLAKSQALVLVLLFIFLHLLFKRRYLSLVIVSFLYVWLYAGWPLLLVITALYGIVNVVYYRKKNNWLVVRKIRSTVAQQSWLLLLTVGVGLLSGLFFNPYFPKNLFFYWQQTFKIGLVNYQNIIGVGAEWYPYAINDLFFDALPLFLLIFVAIITFVITAHRQPMQSWFFFILSFLFFALTLKSRRNVEYFVPFALLFCALTMNVVMPTIVGYVKKLKLTWLSGATLAVVMSGLIAISAASVQQTYARSFSFEHFSAPALWLKEHAPDRAIVLHSDWDEFPFLFYYNSDNYYLVGLDPTFMYLSDPGLHERWINITSGTAPEDVYPTVKNLFNAEYVFVEYTSHQLFDEQLQHNIYFEQVYSDDSVRIYHVIGE